MCKFQFMLCHNRVERKLNKEDKDEEKDGMGRQAVSKGGLKEWLV